MRKFVPSLTKDELKLMLNGNGGIHLAGYTDMNGMKVPCLWHIHNGKSQTLPEKKINPRALHTQSEFG